MTEKEAWSIINRLTEVDMYGYGNPTKTHEWSDSLRFIMKHGHEYEEVMTAINKMINRYKEHSYMESLIPESGEVLTAIAEKTNINVCLRKNHLGLGTFELPF